MIQQWYRRRKLKKQGENCEKEKMWQNFKFFDDVRHKFEEQAQIKIAAIFRGYRARKRYRTKLNRRKRRVLYKGRSKSVDKRKNDKNKLNPNKSKDLRLKSSNSRRTIMPNCYKRTETLGRDFKDLSNIIIPESKQIPKLQNIQKSIITNLSIAQNDILVNTSSNQKYISKISLKINGKMQKIKEAKSLIQKPGQFSGKAIKMFRQARTKISSLSIFQSRGKV